jgi:hypothetical protein
MHCSIDKAMHEKGICHGLKEAGRVPFSVAHGHDIRSDVLRDILAMLRDIVSRRLCEKIGTKRTLALD